MEGESRVTPSIIDEFHSWDIQGDQIEGESGVNRSIIDDLLFGDIQRGKMEGKIGVTRSIIDQLRSADMVKWKVKVALLKVSLKNLIVVISKDIKGNVQVVLHEGSVMNFIL